MRRYIFMLIILIFCLILPGTVFHYLSWNGIKPDLAMLWIIYIALHHRPSEGVAYGFATGLIVDMYFSRYIGMYTITLAVVAFLISLLQQRWYRDNIPLTVLLVFLASFLGQIIVSLLANIAGLNWDFGNAFRMIFGISLYNALLVPITYPLVNRSFTQGILKQKSNYERGY
ncbi:MAG: rod shape-determining protein MreD [Gracilibacter sp. BRH_c7a]|nr:MAG: rod shape-determining protein MreD [Gracilibacter sp. BRH_c7a]